MTRGSIDISVRGGTAGSTTSGSSNRPRVSLSLAPSSTIPPSSSSSSIEQESTSKVAAPKNSGNVPTLRREGSSKKGTGTFRFEGSSEEEDGGHGRGRRVSDDSEDEEDMKKTKNKKKAAQGGKKGKTATRRMSRESSMSSDEEEEEEEDTRKGRGGKGGGRRPGSNTLSSNEARRGGFNTLKKKGEAVRKALSAKLLADPGRFDKLQRKWREADEDGSGFLDKEAFIDVMYILLRQKSRPSEDEMAWLCQQLRSKNKQIAYREVRAVLMGDYYDGSSYMPMWATAAFPQTPSPYMPAGAAPLMSPVPFFMAQPSPAVMATMRGPMLGGATQRQVSFDDYGRLQPHAEDMAPSSGSWGATRRSSGSGGSSGRSQAFSFSAEDTGGGLMATQQVGGLSLPLDTMRKPPSSAGPHTGRSNATTELTATSRRKGKASASHKAAPSKSSKDSRQHQHHHHGRDASPEDERDYHRHWRRNNDDRSPDRRRRGGGGHTSARTWPDSEEEEEDSEEEERNRWAALPGTVGEWLRYAASPLERRNFEELMQMLEEFGYDRGLQTRGPGGPSDSVVVQLGSLLHARISFHVAQT